MGNAHAAKRLMINDIAVQCSAAGLQYVRCLSFPLAPSPRGIIQALFRVSLASQSVMSKSLLELPRVDWLSEDG